MIQLNKKEKAKGWVLPTVYKKIFGKQAGIDYNKYYDYIWTLYDDTIEISKYDKVYKRFSLGGKQDVN